ncbi:MAG: hypothetical protein QNJ91_09980 [Gammaproteobacteria bacterium]|nr:hypothetical protein [Gammaproteobacteria bacterium]
MKNPSADGVGGHSGQLDLEVVRYGPKLSTTVDDSFIVGELVCGRHAEITVVVDFSDDLFEQVFQRRDTPDIAVLVDGDSEVTIAPTEGLESLIKWQIL